MQITAKDFLREQLMDRVSSSEQHVVMLEAEVVDAKRAVFMASKALHDFYKQDISEAEADEVLRKNAEAAQKVLDDYFGHDDDDW